VCSPALASQRLHTTLAGKLIVLETLSALAYAFVLRGRAPAPFALLGNALLMVGVAWARGAARAHSRRAQRGASLFTSTRVTAAPWRGFR
jgi:hypothetical protein